jgi:hypothetical protein
MRSGRPSCVSKPSAYSVLSHSAPGTLPDALCREGTTKGRPRSAPRICERTSSMLISSPFSCLAKRKWMVLCCNREARVAAGCVDNSDRALRGSCLQGPQVPWWDRHATVSKFSPKNLCCRSRIGMAIRQLQIGVLSMIVWQADAPEMLI